MKKETSKKKTSSLSSKTSGKKINGKASMAEGAATDEKDLKKDGEPEGEDEENKFIIEDTDFLFDEDSNEDFDDFDDFDDDDDF